jgi:lysophospholipase L1-like esterase
VVKGVDRRRGGSVVPPRIQSRRKVFYAALVFIAVLALAEFSGRILLENSRLGRLAQDDPAPPADDLRRLLPVPGEKTIAVPENVDRILYRDRRDPESGDLRVWMESPLEEPAAILLGGSAPYGLRLKNRETFWWRLDHAIAGDVVFLNLASTGNTSTDVRHQIADFVGFGGRTRLVVVYVGDNEWWGFRYPVLPGAVAARLDEWLKRSSAYLSLRTLIRAVSQTTVYEDLERQRRWSALSLTRFPLDTRYTDFDRDTREFVDQCRRLVLERTTSNLEAVIDLARTNGADVILVASPLRYRLSPAHNISQVASERHAGTIVESRIVAHLSTAIDDLIAGDATSAEDALGLAYRLDPESSLTNHYLGYLWESRGDFERARSHFGVARDRTIGYGGLMLQIRQAMLSLADRKRVPVVDLKTAFDRHSDRYGNGLGDELLIDWCHPSATGAEVIFDELRSIIVDELGFPEVHAVEGP